mmetsp:Transcript_6106/g.9124  ORF Transcript_6106/g.9124 Transcript_6106/m.9124 type:complete len:224 (-) Transcript_6106:1472-2143(-)
MAVSIGDIGEATELLLNRADVNFQIKNKAIPQVSPLHIACRYGNLDIVKLLTKSCNINCQDQFGFTSLHYAVVSHKRDVVMYLLSMGASTIIESKAGSTPLDLAEKLKFTEIIDALRSKLNMEKDPNIPKFREWLNHIGSGEYMSKFLDAGYDLAFISLHGLTDTDLDCVGIPMTRLGLRRKLTHLHDIKKFYTPEEEDREEEEDEEEEENSDDDDEEESDED